MKANYSDGSSTFHGVTNIRDPGQALNICLGPGKPPSMNNLGLELIMKTDVQ